MKLTERILISVFYKTKEKVAGTSHWGRMVDELESMGIQITTGRHRTLNTFYKNMNRGINLSN